MFWAQKIDFQAENFSKKKQKIFSKFQAEAEQSEACKKFEEITGLSKNELKELKTRRVQAFKKNLTDLAELEIKHSKVHRRNWKF